MRGESGCKKMTALPTSFTAFKCPAKLKFTHKICMEKPRRGQVYNSPGQMNFGFVNQCQVMVICAQAGLSPQITIERPACSESPEIQAIAKNFTAANRAFSAI